MNNCWVYWSNEASNSKLLLIGQGMQTTFFHQQIKQNKEG